MLVRTVLIRGIVIIPTQVVNTRQGRVAQDTIEKASFNTIS